MLAVSLLASMRPVTSLLGLLLTVGFSLAAAAVFMPTAAATPCSVNVAGGCLVFGCVVNNNDCFGGACLVNTGSCNYGGTCAVNTGNCQSSCTVNTDWCIQGTCTVSTDSCNYGDCRVNVGTEGGCDNGGACTINVEMDPNYCTDGGTCTINLVWCQGTNCLVAMGPVSTNADEYPGVIFSKGNCSGDCLVESGIACQVAGCRFIGIETDFSDFCVVG